MRIRYLTPDARKEYLSRGTGLCPTCGSSNIACRKHTKDVNSVRHWMRCIGCKALWADVYKLSHVEIEGD
jgi:formate dehydrogenase maturation protein FdhE